MGALTDRINALTTRIATEFKSVRFAIAAIPAPSTLIDDTATSGATKVWSVDKLNSAITTKINALVAGAPAALDTLGEIAAQIQQDETGAAAMTVAIGNRVRYDAAQSLTTDQTAQARANISAFGAPEIGAYDTDFVAAFNAALT